MKPYQTWLAIISINCITFIAGQQVGQEQTQEVCNEEVKPYKEVLLGCLNNGTFHFPDTLEAFSCDTTYLGTLKGPYHERTNPR